MPLELGGVSALLPGSAYETDALLRISTGDIRGFVLLHVLPALLVTALFASIALRLRSVTHGGAAAGSAISITIFICTGLGGFATLATVFVLTAVATRLGYDRKRRIGTSEHGLGRRASQVLANLTVAAAASLGGLSEHYSWLVVPMIAALAEAAADTVSSELGQAWSNRVYLVTSFERVAVGTDGGISLPGTAAGVAAACVTAYVPYGLHLLSPHQALLAGGAAVLGMFADSLLGAAFERRRYLGNNAVNFLSTAIAGGLAALFSV